MSSVRNRLFYTESLRHTAIYAALFAGSMVVLIAVVYLILDNSFKANLMREVDDDLTSIRTAYSTAKKGREVHEAEEMITDRLLAPDVEDIFLLQRGAVRLAGNVPPMAVRIGAFSVQLPAVETRGPTGGKRLVMGRGLMLSDRIFAFVGRDLHQVRETETGILYAFGLVLFVSLILASISGLLLSRTFLRRVDAITATCNGIMAGRLSERITDSGKVTEFELLGQAINAILDRIQI